MTDANILLADAAAAVVVEAGEDVAAEAEAEAGMLEVARTVAVGEGSGYIARAMAAMEDT